MFRAFFLGSRFFSEQFPVGVVPLPDLWLSCFGLMRDLARFLPNRRQAAQEKQRGTERPNGDFG
jgi:hypothetical protein